MTNKECKVLQYKAHYRVWAHLVGEGGEHIYGGGEQYTYLDLKVTSTIDLRRIFFLN